MSFLSDMVLLSEIQPAGAYLVFGEISETVALLFFGIGLIVLTIGVRWLIGRRSAPKIDTKL